MAETGQTAVAWEMLSSVVVMRAKARENKLPKLLSSLHGVEVELARIIAGSDSSSTSTGELNGSLKCKSTLLAPSRQLHGFSEVDGPGLETEMALKSRSSRRGAGSRGDQQLRTLAKKYLAITRQLKELVSRGEAVASQDQFGDPLDEDWEGASDTLLTEQHDLAFTIAAQKATTLDGLSDKAAVLDDLIEENEDDPVQVLARSLARDVMALSQKRK